MTLLLSICPPVQSVDGRGQRRERGQVIGQEDGTVFSLAVAALLEGIKRAAEAAAAADNMTTKLLGITALVATPTPTPTVALNINKNITMITEMKMKMEMNTESQTRSHAICGYVLFVDL